MNPILNISEDELMDLIEKILTVFKQIMAWLGILVLPEEGQIPEQPSEETAELS